MKKYFSFFRIRFISGLSYRAAAWSGVFTQFFWGAMLILSFSAFYRTNPDAFSMDFSSLCSYIWLQQACITLFTLWRLDNSIFTSIMHGDIAYELARPIGLYETWLFKDIGACTSACLLRFIPVFAISIFLPSPYALKAPESLLFGILFLLSMCLSVLVISSIRMLLYISAFHTLNPQGTRVVLVSITEFLSGAIIPLPFFPDQLRQVIELTPFATIQSSPFLIYTGCYSVEKAFLMVALQLFWAFMLILAGKIWLSCSLRRVVVQGG